MTVFWSRVKELAEREGFEPSRRLNAPYSLSRRAPSTTRPPLRRAQHTCSARLKPKASGTWRRHLSGACGGGGIRTHETLLGPTVFKTVSLDHSDTPPGRALLRTMGRTYNGSRRGRDSNPRGGVSPLRHFECRALDRTMRPLQGRWRRERDLNPRGSVNPQRHFQCRALDQTMRSLLDAGRNRQAEKG